MNWWKQLSLKIPFIMLILALAPIIIYGVSVNRQAKQTLMENIRRADRAMITNVITRTENLVRHTLDGMTVATGLTEINPAQQGGLEYALQLIQKEMPQLRTLTLLDDKGMEAAKISMERFYTKADLVSRTDAPMFFQTMENRPYIGPVRISQSGTRRITLAVPLVDIRQRSPAGVLAAEVSVRKLLEEIQDINIGKNGFIYVLDSTGRLISHPDFSRVLAGEKLSQNAHFRHYLEGEKGLLENLHRHINTDGQEVLSMGIESPMLNWVFMSEQPAGEALALIKQLNRELAVSLLAILGVTLLSAVYLFFVFSRPMKTLARAAEEISSGNLDHQMDIASKDEIGQVAASFNNMAENLRTSDAERKQNAWHKTGQSELDRVMRGDQTLEALCRGVITQVVKYIGAQVGALYVNEKDDAFLLKASYAFQVRKNLSNAYAPGEGLVGQAALEGQPILLTGVPEDYMPVRSGLGETPPRNILIHPFSFNDQVIGVIEIGGLSPFGEDHMAFLGQAEKSISAAVHAALNKSRLQQSLELTRQQSEDLKMQQEELTAKNEELEEYTQQIQASEKRLKTQQEELRATNEELEEKTQAIEEQKERVEQKNQELQQIQLELEDKAAALETASRYKSEFLANMSHELRTPLNSLLILAQDFAENRGGNLNAEQVESAELIYKSGNDLLALINDILDLSKIEAGRMTLHREKVRLPDLGERIRSQFQHMADEKGLTLSVDMDEDLPGAIVSDVQRIEQILRNLTANAIKFTNQGSVELVFHRPGSGIRFSRNDLAREACVAISVKDTGIGIPTHRQNEIFDAFRQIDGGTSRRYGGTGLGLTISRQMADLLGGEIQLKSEENKGSVFTLFLPASHPPSGDKPAPDVHPPRQTAASGKEPDTGKAHALPDDRDEIGPDDRVLLVIEDDPKFAGILHRFCREKAWRFIHAGNGQSGLDAALTYQPDAVILDLGLPDMHGAEVLEKLKQNPKTRHIPVHVMTVEQESLTVFRKGAAGFLQKPADRKNLDAAFSKIQDFIERKIKKLLVVENDPVMQKKIADLIGNGDVVTDTVSTGQDALTALTEDAYDCVILDLNLPDQDGFDVLEQFDHSRTRPLPPVIVYTGRDLTREEEARLSEYAASIIVKGVRSEERLLDETALFLHRVIEKLPANKQQLISKIYNGDDVFQGKSILLVDDDMRNAFAVSKVLEDRGMRVHKAADGRKALAVLEKEPAVDLVLMDLMMPEMDGFEAIGRIRKMEKWRTVPIIALTAKAMLEDRDRCIAAGANDYLAKPVDMTQLLSLMRVWLYQ